MATRWSLSDVVAAQNRLASPAVAPPSKPQSSPQPAAAPARTRHGNRKVEYQGQKFDSQHELQVFKDFELERAAGKIRAVVRQVSMPIAGSRRRIRLDFMIVENDGGIRWVDAKGFCEREWLLKRDIVQAACGISIETC